MTPTSSPSARSPGSEDARLSIETGAETDPLLLSTEGGLDQEFIRELKRRVAAER